MLSIKITPLFLFLLLLIVLVISVIFGNRFLAKEGFVSFQQSKNPIEYVSIPTYSTTATPVKLYDNIYFDNKNGNLIEVDSTSYSGTVDSTGKTIATTNVVPRANSQNSVSFTSQISGTSVTAQDTKPSLIANVSHSYKSYVYPTQSKNTDKYDVFYFPWNDQTYIHVLNITKSSNVSSFYFGPSNKMETFVYPSNTPIGITGYVAFTDANNNSQVVEPFYDAVKTVYQIGKYVKYDIANGNLIIQTVDGQSKTISVYGRNNTKQDVTAAGKFTNNLTSVSNVSFTPFIVKDVLGQNMVLYLPYQTNTVVALIGYTDSSKSAFTINNVCRFTSTTIDSGDSSTSVSHHKPEEHIKDSEMSEYFKWYWYWKSNGKPEFNYSDDYLLKTQIVPPVCPSCPTCNGGSCANCSGGNVVASGLTISTPAINNTKNVVSSTTNVASNTNPVRDEYHNNSIGGVLNTGLNTVGSVAGKTIGAAEHIVTNVVDDATGLLKGAGSGIKDVLTSRPMNIGKDNTTIQGPNGKPITINRTEGAFQSPYGPTMGTQSGDQFSYYGALPSKGDSNYMPLTSDFSKFGR
jgi:hypothetical protein